MTNKEILENVLENCKDKQKVRDALVEPYPEIYKFGQDCASSKEALEELKLQVGNINYVTHDLQSTFIKVRDSGLFEIIEKDLEKLNENKELLLELVCDEIARLKLHEHRCDEWGLEILNKRISRLEKLKEWLER